jgi:hypothetical protein
MLNHVAGVGIVRIPYQGRSVALAVSGIALHRMTTASTRGRGPFSPRPARETKQARANRRPLIRIRVGTARARRAALHPSRYRN